MAGFDLNEDETSYKDVAGVTKHCLQTGVTQHLPTVVTGSDKRIHHALSVIAKACDTDETVRNSAVGIHLEGPYISEHDGPRGAHNVKYVCNPDWDQFQRWQESSGGRITMVTLAPEREGAMSFIAKLAGQGIVVCLGHTMASTEQIEQAVQAGAASSTHLGNGAHPILARHPNYIWDQLAEDRLYGSFISDGHHLSFRTLKAMLRAKGDKAILVSDAVKFAGMSPGEYASIIIGGNVVLGANGRLSTKSNPNILAGSANTIPEGIGNVVQWTGFSLKDTVDMVTARPAKLMGLDHHGRMLEGFKANLTLFSIQPDGKARVEESVLNGKSAYMASAV